jgi:hypothetical protein
MKDILEQSNLQPSTGWRMLLWALVALGVLMFIIGLVTGDAERTWQAFLINTMFWGGLSFAGVMFSVIWQITDARWGRPFKRIAEGFGSFLPVALLAFVAVWFGAPWLFEWVHHPHLTTAAYLNLPFFVTRSVIVLGVLFTMSVWYLRTTLKPDLAVAQRLIPGWGGAFAQRLLKNYGEHETEVVRLEQLSRRLAPALAMMFAVGWSLIAIDYLMSLDQTWFSTLFGVYVIIGDLYSALALMLIIAAFVRNKPGISEYMTINRYHDLAKLTFAIAALYAYMVFSQYLVIWYSNLPEESPYLVTRSIAPTPWTTLFWILVCVEFVLPFLALMPRTVCRKPPLAATIGAILLVGQWWANYLLVVPSIQDRHADSHFMFGIHEVLLTAGFAGAFFLCFFWFMRRVPILPISDYHLCKSWHGH